MVGGGTAGAAACLEAAAAGASVTLFERSKELPTPGSEWLESLDGRRPGRGLRALSLADAGVEVRAGTAVDRVEEGPGLKLAGGGGGGFDSVVVSTGASPVEPGWPRGRDGYFVLDRPGAYRDLRSFMEGASSAAVTGSGLRSLEVAERLLWAGTEVVIYAAGGPLSERLGEAATKALRQSIAASDVLVVDALPDKFLGVAKVEAAVVGSEVTPCEAAAVVPSFRPFVVPSPCFLGRAGGVVVDDRCRTGVKGVFAAGGCSEVPLGAGTVPVTTENAAELMGKVAGANAAGASVSSAVADPVSASLFGTEVVAAGFTLRAARSCGLEADESAWAEGQQTAAVVFDKGTHRVLGVQLVGPGSLSSARVSSQAVSAGLRLEQMAYSEQPTDISAASEAAREGLKRVR